MSQSLILAYIFGGTIFKADSKGPDTQLRDITFQETSNLPNLSSTNTTIVSFTEENIVIRTHLPYVSSFPRNIPKEIVRKNKMNRTNLLGNADHIVDAAITSIAITKDDRFLDSCIQSIWCFIWSR